MARIPGRNARVYLGLATSAAAAEPVAYQAKVSFDKATDKLDVTAFGDTNKVYVAGLPDASGAFDGFYDDATAQTYTAADDGLPRKMYIYPSTLTNSQYFFTTAIVDFSFEAGVGDPATVSANWSAASAFIKVG